MNTIWHSALLASLLLVAAPGRGAAAEAKTNYPPTAAHDLLEAAIKKAGAESKAVFIKSGYPECGWCVVFDRYHATPEVRQILDKYYVIVSIDTENMPDGDSTFSKYAMPAAPSWVIISPEREVIVDSFRPEGNIGYPGEPEGSAYYLTALKKATPAITDAELRVLAKQIQKAKGE